jgi:hypothetical protein
MLFLKYVIAYACLHVFCACSGESIGTFLSVRLRAKPEVVVSIPFKFWAAPEIQNAAFEQSGVVITVSFTYDTDRAGMFASTSCGILLADAVLPTLGVFPAVSDITSIAHLAFMIFMVVGCF